MESLKQRYQERAKQFEQSAEELNVKYNRFSFVRLIIFLAAVGLSIIIWMFHFAAGIAFIMLFLVGFYRFVRWHQQILYQKKITEALALINTQEKEAQDHHFEAFFSGADFLDQQHPYALDLDILVHSLCFNIPTAVNLLLVKKRLANYLTEVASNEEISLRQEATQELAQELDWRQNLQALGKLTEDQENHIRLLHHWLDAPFFVSNRRWLVLSLYLMPFWVAAGVVLWIFYLPWQVAILFFVPPAPHPAKYAQAS